MNALGTKVRDFCFTVAKIPDRKSFVKTHGKDFQATGQTKFRNFQKLEKARQYVSDLSWPS